MIKKDDIVTLKLENTTASNTFIVKSIDNGKALLFHPLAPTVYIEEPLENLNTVAATLKDSSERNLDFARANSKFLDFNTNADLDALCLYFAVTRKLTPKQKGTLANMLGRVAAIKFDNDISAAMEYVKKNAGVLDDFNGMWYRNFRKLFSGKKLIVSSRQRDSIFNITGFVLAELETPTVQK